MTEQRTQLTSSGTVNPVGEFEILSITEGEAVGHGFVFPASVLRESLSLWDGVECFVDHTAPANPRSVRNLGGICHSPAWNEAERGVQLKLKAKGPAGTLVEALGREMLAADEPKPKVGFSADVAFLAKDKQATKILKVYSVDLVFDPARGGRFVRALNSVGAWSVTRPEWAATAQGGTMTEEVQAAAAPAAAAPNADLEAVRTLLQVQAEQERLAAEAAKAREIRAQMCNYLLDSGLAASKLPQPAQDSLRKQFAGQVFEPSALTAAIEGMRQMVSALTGPGSVQGPSAIRGMFSSGDQIQAAVFDLFDVKRDAGSENLKVHKLSGVRELYHGLTGDFDFYGGVYPERAQFQLTTSNFSGLVKNAMNKALIERWDQLGKAGYDWWTKVCHIEHFRDVKDITWLIFGTVASLSSISEGAEYPEIKIGDSPETSSFTKYGGYVGITLEALMNDDTRKLKAIPRELAAAAIRNISSVVAAIFSVSSYAGPTMADTGALFNNTAVTTKGGHANLTSTALGTDYTAWNVSALAMYKQPMLVAQETSYYGTGKYMAIWPNICLVCPTLKASADALFVPRWANAPYVGATIPSAGAMTYGGMVTPIVVPDWTSTTAWFAVADPVLVPGVCIGEAFGLMPEIFVAGDELSPAVFMNDESRLKVRHFLAVGVADFRPLSRGNS